MNNRTFSRRGFLGLMASLASLVYLPQSRGNTTDQTAPAGDSGKGSGEPRIGIALGSGGANGLAHILILEAFDEMGLVPYRISGSSIGAVVGGLYASGLSGKAIRDLVERFIISPEERVVEELLSKDALRWVEFLDVEFGEGGLLSSEGFMSFMYDIIGEIAFEDLQIPLKVTAGDLWTREQHVFESGDLLPAVKASMALPGVFQPVVYQGHVLIDGGTVNPVPYDLLIDDCDIVVGIDVIGQQKSSDFEKPGYFQTIFNAAEVMQHAIMTEKLRHKRPTIYISPNIINIRALEFYRAELVFEQARGAKQSLKRQLSEALNHHPA